MQIKYSTSLLTMPSTWINIRRNPFFSYRGHPTFTVVLGPYKPCTTVYIIARLKYGTTTRHLGIFSISTSCPCDPCICIGEPHFTTFEGMCFDFNSDCSYILSQTLQPDAHDFELTANLVSIGGGLSVIESADIVADNHIIYLLEDGTIEIDSQMCDGTAFVVDDLTVAVEIIDQYTQVVFSLTEGWWVLWIKNAKTGHNEIRFEIEDYSPLVGKQRGMLGPKYAANATHTFEGFIKKNGDTTHNIQEFCLSWQVINSCPT
ncbi:mucin-5B-like [Saccoglossus kowalevskii]|uniref:Mucin-5B-like n=1 Tax=Saccoglossus kowalevskii TaxID=10224 RepID=A0ABM0M8D1_SACKO|nr:PREDICTED: mucin-5B-like [Saccoglossus kowalevskii]